jgi:hypothetical protein
MIGSNDTQDSLAFVLLDRILNALNHDQVPAHPLKLVGLWVNLL